LFCNAASSLFSHPDSLLPLVKPEAVESSWSVLPPLPCPTISLTLGPLQVRFVPRIVLLSPFSSLAVNDPSSPSPTVIGELSSWLNSVFATLCPMVISWPSPSPTTESRFLCSWLPSSSISSLLSLPSFLFCPSWPPKKSLAKEDGDEAAVGFLSDDELSLEKTEANGEVVFRGISLDTAKEIVARDESFSVERLDPGFAVWETDGMMGSLEAS